MKKSTLSFLVISIALLVSGCGTIKTKTDPDIIGQIPKTKNIVLRTTLVEYNDEMNIPQKNPPEVNKIVFGDAVEMMKEKLVAEGYTVFNPSDKPDGSIINADLLVAYFEGGFGGPRLPFFPDVQLFKARLVVYHKDHKAVIIEGKSESGRLWSGRTLFGGVIEDIVNKFTSVMQQKPPSGLLH